MSGKRSRVQGGWALPKNIRSDRDKPKASAAPVWLGKNVDQPKEHKFVFEQSEEELKEKPPERIITKAGVYDISTEQSGVSRLRFFPNFIESKDADWMFEQLYHELPWRQRSDVRNGETFLQPRLTVWYGEYPYSYSGVTHQSNKEWSPLLTMLKDRLEEVTGHQFNSMLANMYRDGHDSVDWHCDNERALRKHPTIASLTFGDVRNFELRKIPPPESAGDYRFMEHVKIPLCHGSLLIMGGATQEQWQHRIPKEYHDRGARINLTFRVIYPD
ncbi:hypothetical protein ScPMuIL_013165 [Solemya velum]